MPTIMRIVDFETTGMEPPAEVIEVGWCDFDRDSGTVCGGDSFLCGVRFNPPEARAVHHIWPEDTAGLPAFDPEKLLEFALASKVVAIVTHMAEFEAKWIKRTLEGVIPIVCTYKAALRVWPEAPSHGNFALLYWLMGTDKISPIRERLQPAHRALPDAYATAWILKALFDAKATGADLMRWTREPALLPRCPIGDHRGKPWADVPLGFLVWIVDKRDMDADLKWNAQRELDRRNGMRAGLEAKAGRIDPNYGDPHP